MGMCPSGIKAAHASMGISKVQYSLHLTLLLSNAYPTNEDNSGEKNLLLKRDGLFI